MGVSEGPMVMSKKLKALLPGGSVNSPAAPGNTAKASRKKVILMGGLLLLSILVMAALLSLESALSRQTKTYHSIVLELQVVSQQIANNALEAVAGNTQVFARLADNRNRYINSLRSLEDGNSAQNLPPLSIDYFNEFSRLQSLWQVYDSSINTVVGAEVPIRTLNEYATLINDSLPQLVNLFDGIIEDLVNSKAAGEQVEIAVRQLILIQGLEHSMQQILTEGKSVIAASEQFSTDAEKIEKQLIAMLQGDSAQAINRFVDQAAVAKLVRFADLFSVVKNNVIGILDNSPQLFKVHEAVLNIQSLSPGMLAASDDLAIVIAAKDSRLQILSFAGYGFGALSLLFLAMLTVMVTRDSQGRLSESEQQNEKNQHAILRLLDEMTNLADGDLSTHTTVTEDITGAIADSVNYSIDALRDLVETINETAAQVGSAVQVTQTTTGELEIASIAQAKEISGATLAITEISESMTNISAKAVDSAEVARKSVGIAHNGGETVRQTITGMETIREQIQETSKRIKRLGESSQEIGDIVNLITEISDQTNILALNAAIQASMAGEAGRGFAVVADEVQRLAERTGDATKQIEALVKTIQADTNEATMSMEQSTANVVKGARLTEKAGGALDRIEQVSMNLAQRILEISDSTKSQASAGVKIAETMGVIQEITQKTSAGSDRVSNSIGNLSSMVEAMHKSVAGFKLPELERAISTIVNSDDQLEARDK
ncbi:MAG: chemotaxis protein [Gammaproteobacteria bacterium]|nr:MAG: chemotaxis protein [Gammaproteobacteria bacterium]